MHEEAVSARRGSMLCLLSMAAQAGLLVVLEPGNEPHRAVAVCACCNSSGGLNCERAVGLTAAKLCGH
jgi:hypothetical protein